jgi:tetratricopeptide (TPR) repeat protein
MAHFRSDAPSNLTLVWLGTYIDETGDNTRNLWSIFDSIQTFTDVNRCVDFITEIIDGKVFIIIYSELSQSLVPLIVECIQIHAIYVLFSSLVTNEQWLTHHRKVKGMFMNSEALCDAMTRDIRHFHCNIIPANIIKSSSITNHDELDPSFMYSQLLKEILLDKPDDNQAKQEFVDFCRRYYATNNAQIKLVDEFEEQYEHSSSIWWYTRDCFLYWMLNKALRTQDIELIMKMGFFLRDLHLQINSLYSEEESHHYQKLFRGQGVSLETLNKMRTGRGGLLSFNNFLSTSADRSVGYLYADSCRQDPSLVGILFQIEIDSSVQSTPFTSVQRFSDFVEDEILFSMHTVFRIGDTEEMEDRLWQVTLTLTSDSDPMLTDLMEYIRVEIQGSTDIHRMGQLMIKMGQFDRAQQIYHRLMGQTSDDEYEEIAHLNHQLGFLRREKGDFINALSFYQKTLSVMEKYPPREDRNLATIYHNIGLVHQAVGEQSVALKCLKKTLDIEERCLSPDDPHLASTYCNMGLLHHEMKDYSTALDHYKKALIVEEKFLPSYHQSLSSTYNNIALAYHELEKYSEALAYYEKSCEILEKSLPSDHPLLARTYYNVGHLQKDMGEYSAALSFYEKALQIQKKCLPANHPDLASTMNNIGSVYDVLNDYPAALSHYEKALEIQQLFLSSDAASLATSYNNIGGIHYSMEDYATALSYYHKALEIRQTSDRPDHVDLSTTYNNIGLTYTKTGQYKEALSNYERMLEIQQQYLPSEHSLWATTFNNLGLVHQLLGEYSIALSYFQRTLDINKKWNHPSLAITYSNIGSIHFIMEKYSTALSNYEKALEIQQQSDPLNYSSLSITHCNTAKALENLSCYREAIRHAKQALHFALQSFDCRHQRLHEIREYLQLLSEKLS